MLLGLEFEWEHLASLMAEADACVKEESAETPAGEAKGDRCGAHVVREEVAGGVSGIHVIMSELECDWEMNVSSYVVI